MQNQSNFECTHNNRSEDIKVTPQVNKIPTMDKSAMDKSERIKRLKECLTLSNVKHEDQVMKLSTLKEAHTY